MEFNCKKLKKKEGNINLMICYMGLIIVTLLIAFSMARNRVSILHNRIEDSLVASNLAAATVDINKYADEGIIVNIDREDVKKSYDAFISTLKSNLELKDDMTLKESSFISSKINVEKFIIYSDLKTHTQINQVSSNGAISSSTGSVGMSTPNGKKVKDTTIYAKLSFQITFMGKTMNVSKDNVVIVTEK